MDDLQFRRSVYANPHTKDATILQAAQQDESKQQFMSEIQALDNKISKALEIPVPDDLANRLILKQTLASHREQKRKSRIQLALAASVAFAVGISVNLMQVSPAFATIGDYALAHTHHEETNFSNTMPAKVTLTSVNEKFAQFGGQFTKSMGKLISASICDFGGVKALHLVYQGKHKPITVFVLPAEHDFKMQKQFADTNLHGIANQVKNANVIIVGDKNEALQQWQANLQKDIRWSI